jgi:hypothetical protein
VRVAGRLEARHATEGVDRRSEVFAQRVDDADEVTRLRVVRAALADGFERLPRLLQRLGGELGRVDVELHVLGVAQREAVEILRAEVVRGRLDLGRRQPAQPHEVLVDAFEVVGVDRDLDQAAERALYERSVAGLIGALDDHLVAAARPQVVAGLEQRLAQKKQRVRHCTVTGVVLDDVGEDDAGADVVLQAEEQLAVCESLFDVGRAAQLGLAQRRLHQLLGLGLDLGQLAQRAFEALSRGVLQRNGPERRKQSQQPMRLPQHQEPPAGLLSPRSSTRSM